MKRLGYRWAAGLAGAGAAMGVAWVLAVGGALPAAHGGQDEEMPAVGRALSGTAQDPCDDACVRSRGVAALVVLSQRPPQ